MCTTASLRDSTVEGAALGSATMPIDREAAARAIDAFLQAIGRDPAVEPDLVGTGARVTDAFLNDLCAGYAVDTRALVLGHAMAAPPQPGLVVVRDLPVVTTCPHHLMPAAGIATVAFQPARRLVGLGAIAELVNAHARRLTLQERIGADVADDLAAVLAPEWVGVRLLLSHGCMTARGERATGARVETVELRGATTHDRIRLAHAALGLPGA
jgi:GTP cyclohydrolase I